MHGCKSVIWNHFFHPLSSFSTYQVMVLMKMNIMKGVQFRHVNCFCRKMRTSLMQQLFKYFFLCTINRYIIHFALLVFAVYILLLTLHCWPKSNTDVYTCIYFTYILDLTLLTPSPLPKKGDFSWGWGSIFTRCHYFVDLSFFAFLTGKHWL